MLLLSNLIEECKNKFSFNVAVIRHTIKDVIDAVRAKITKENLEFNFTITDKKIVAALTGAIREVRRRRFDSRTGNDGIYIPFHEIQNNYSKDDLIAVNGDFLKPIVTYICYCFCLSYLENGNLRELCEKLIKQFCSEVENAPLFVGDNRFIAWANSAVREVRRRYPDTLIDDSGKFIVFEEISQDFRTNEKPLVIQDDRYKNHLIYYMLYAASLELNNRDLANHYLQLFNNCEVK
ncbi:hypothetical protein AAEX28_07295 [Lentisphaerota bacterium WC36G]|nr:hypothetical protein LJT99_10155 [Lentisphaerae bacterium WC36]